MNENKKKEHKTRKNLLFGEHKKISSHNVERSLFIKSYTTHNFSHSCGAENKNHMFPRFHRLLATTTQTRDQINLRKKRVTAG